MYSIRLWTPDSIKILKELRAPDVDTCDYVQYVFIDKFVITHREYSPEIQIHFPRFYLTVVGPVNNRVQLVLTIDL